MQDNKKHPSKPIDDEVAKRSHEGSQKIGLQRGLKRDPHDPADNQKSKPEKASD